MGTWFAHGFDSSKIRYTLTCYIEQHGAFNYEFGFTG